MSYRPDPREQQPSKAPGPYVVMFPNTGTEGVRVELLHDISHLAGSAYKDVRIFMLGHEVKVKVVVEPLQVMRSFGPDDR